MTQEQLAGQRRAFYGRGGAGNFRERSVLTQTCDEVNRC
jgi:hypothetical protein